MPTVTAIITDAYQEIGVLAPSQTLDSALGALGLLRFQQLLDSWQADRLALAVQSRVTFTMPSATSSVTIGPSGSVTTTPATTTAPMWLDTVCYVNPGSSPAQEVVIGVMDRDTYASLSIKTLSSALPLQCFYQRSNTDALGTLFVWPQVSQNVTMVLYAPQGVGVPTSLSDVVTGPPGYLRVFCKVLALELCSPTGRTPPELLPMQAAQAKRDMQRPNNLPGLMSLDAAVTSSSSASAYNVLSDVNQTSR